MQEKRKSLTNERGKMKTIYTARELNTGLQGIIKTRQLHPAWKSGDFWQYDVFEKLVKLAMMNKPAYTFDISKIPSLAECGDMIENTIKEAEQIMSVLKKMSRKG